MVSRGLLAAVMIAVAVTGVAAQQPAPQNPSPMVESTRSHERLTPKPLAGTTKSFPGGPEGRALEIFIPDRLQRRSTFDLVVHFHGATFLPQRAVADLNGHSVAAVVNLGAGSGVYHRALADPTVFDTLLARVSREVSAASGKQMSIGSITLTGFSAGHGAIRAILLEPRQFDAVDAILLMDGMHTSYVPERKVMADSGTLDTTNLAAFANFARAAVRGEKRFLVTHSEIFPGTFASTTETADWLLRAIDMRRKPALEWGPRGMQQTSSVRAGRFELMGFAGNSAPDHVDHLHAMPELLRRLLNR